VPGAVGLDDIGSWTVHVNRLLRTLRLKRGAAGSRTTSSKTLRALGSVAVAATLSTGCLAPPPAPDHAPVTVTTTLPAHPPPIPSTAAGYPQLGGTEPGALISATEFDTIDPRITATGATAWRIRYMSTSAVGNAPVEVTGLVIVPGGSPPDGGWQVIAFDHGNTGITPDCGPSLYEDLTNQWGPTTVLMMHGFALVMTDYEGLGGSGHHPFLNAAPLGRDVIDAVRAARHLRPDIGSRWAAFGGSLGGLATWAANEQATTYGAGLDLVGAASWVPLVNVSELPAKAMQRRLTHDQLHLYFAVIMALKDTTHPEIDLTRYIHGAMYENRELLMVCEGPRVNDALAVLKNADPEDLVPADDAAERQMTQWLAEMAVPQQRTAAPMIVIYGSRDLLVDQPWVETAIDRACAMGDTIQWVLRPGEGHGDIDASQAFAWVRARFDNQAPINRCPAGPIRR
jgi:alpha-beta hydrolase superfamily lysophospholipase